MFSNRFALRVGGAFLVMGTILGAWEMWRSHFSERALIEHALQRSVIIKTALNDGNMSRGSGVDIGLGYVLTNHHVVGESPKSVTVDGAPAIIVDGGSDPPDLALLYVPERKQLPPLKLALDPRQGDHIVFSMHARLYDGLLSMNAILFGTIADIQNGKDPRSYGSGEPDDVPEDIPGLEWLLLDIRIAGGGSGGGVYRGRRLAGVGSMKFYDHHGDDVLTGAISARTIESFLQKNGWREICEGASLGGFSRRRRAL